MTEVNQQVIADRLGVSRATVSRCFTNHAGISPLTRAKVFQIASQIGYTHMETRTSAGRKATAPKRRTRLCVLICGVNGGKPDAPEEAGEQVIVGVSEYAQLIGAGIELHRISAEIDSIDHPEIRGIEILAKRKAGGVILIQPFPIDVVKQLALRFPLVSLVDQLDGDPIDCIDVDHYHGISDLVEYLVGAGHRRIGFFTRRYPVKASWSFRRYGAFIEKMAELRLEVLPGDVVGMFPEDDHPLEVDVDNVVRRIESGVTAWICAADHQAADLMEGLSARQLRVPEDVSIVGFGGTGADGGKPDLTTIETPYREIGATGTERLAARLRKRFHETRRVFISGRLREGGSVARIGGGLRKDG